MQVRRVLALCAIVTLVGVAQPVLAQGDSGQAAGAQPPAQGPTLQQQQDVEALVRLVDAVSEGQQPPPAEIPVTLEGRHFLKGQDGLTYIPFTIALDRSTLTNASVALYVRVADRQPAAAAPATTPGSSSTTPDAAAPAGPPARPIYAWDIIQMVEVPPDGTISRAIALKPGEYDAFITVKERTPEQATAAPATPAEPVPGKFGMLRESLSVPDFASAGLATSTVILASDVEILTTAITPAQQEENPYIFGPMKIVPAPEATFGKSSELQVLFWIYGARDTTGGKPDVQVEYHFHHRSPDGEKYFNRTDPQDLNAQTLPAEFSASAGHQLQGSLIVPLESFPTGDYRLEIKVTDKVGGQTTTENVNFTVLPV